MFCYKIIRIDDKCEEKVLNNPIISQKKELNGTDIPQCQVDRVSMVEMVSNTQARSGLKSGSNSVLKLASNSIFPSTSNSEFKLASKSVFQSPSESVSKTISKSVLKSPSKSVSKTVSKPMSKSVLNLVQKSQCSKWLEKSQSSYSPLALKNHHRNRLLFADVIRKWHFLALALLLHLTPTMSQGTSWVYQTHTPFTIQKDFQKFVENAGGNYKRFKFFGNFLSSAEHQLKENEGLLASNENFIASKGPTGIIINDQSSDLTNKLSKSLNSNLPTIEIDTARVPKHFYQNIFDASIPEDEPYHTEFGHEKEILKIIPTLSTTKTKQPNRQSKKKIGFLSNPFQPFSRNFLKSRVPFQKNKLKREQLSQINEKIPRKPFKSSGNRFGNSLKITGFSHRHLGPSEDSLNKNTIATTSFSLGNITPKPLILEPLYRHHFPKKKKLNQDNSDKVSTNSEFFSSSSFGSKSLTSNIKDVRNAESSNIVSLPPVKNIEYSSYSTQLPFLITEPELQVLSSSDRISRTFGHNEHQTPDNSDNRKSDAFMFSKELTTTSIQAPANHGCVSPSDGSHHLADDVWYGHLCTKHTCVHFRGRFFVETDSCKTEIHNTSYRCQVLVDDSAQYPDCCPRYQCGTPTPGHQ